ncbi:sugar ABC transporter substrate-binding protein [Spirochaetia bacterium]|nr:sugar ABC transporter substrate-binding protein [Spirochaetia bacterium]
MHRRKFFLLVTTLVALVAMVSGCGGKSSAGTGTASQGKKTLRVMIWGSTESATEYLKYFYEQFPDFAAKCNVEYFVGGPGDNDCAEKMRLALASGESICDINQLNYTQIAEFARAGALMELEDLIGPVRNDLITGFRLLSEYDGKAYAVPASIKAKIWFYRKDIFDQAGVSPSDVKTLDDFIAAGKKIQSINPNYHMWTMATSQPMYQYMMALSGTDASFSDMNGKFLLTGNPNFKKILEAYRKLKLSGVVADVPEWTPDWEKAFADELLVSYPNATWLSLGQFLPKYAGPSQQGKWYAAQWPSFIGEVGGSEAGGDIYVIPKYSKEPELAKEYMRLRFLTADGYFLQKKVGVSAVPMMRSWVNDPRATEPDPYIGGDYVGETVKSIETFKIFPWDPAAQLELDIVGPYFDAAINGDTPIDTALRNAQADLENQVGNPWDR